MTFKLMVVDDDVHLAEVIVEAANQRGLDAWAVTDPRNVLGAARERQPDVMLLDLGMPAIDGRDLLARLKADAETAGIAIFVVTGWADEYTRALCLDYGAIDFIKKPIDCRRLLERIEEVGAVSGDETAS